MLTWLSSSSSKIIMVTDGLPSLPFVFTSMRPLNMICTNTIIWEVSANENTKEDFIYNYHTSRPQFGFFFLNLNDAIRERDAARLFRCFQFALLVEYHVTKRSAQTVARSLETLDDIMDGIFKALLVDRKKSGHHGTKDLEQAVKIILTDPMNGMFLIILLTGVDIPLSKAWTKVWLTLTFLTF